MDDNLKLQIYVIASILEFRLEHDYNKGVLKECLSNAFAKYLYDNDADFREFIAEQKKK